MKNLFFLADSGSPIKLKNSREVRKLNDFYEFTLCRHVTTSTCIESLLRINIRAQLVTFIIFAPLYVNHKKLHHSGGLRIIYFYLLFVLAFQ